MSPVRSLVTPSALFAEPSRGVALAAGERRQRLRTAGDLARDAGALALRIEATPGDRALVVVDDGYALAVALLALWRGGKVAVIPPNGEPGTLARLRPDVGAILSDRASLLAAGGLHPEAPGRDGEDGDVSWPDLDRDAPACELFTSGTTGDGKPVLKRLRHLDDEVAVLERSLGGPLEGAAILGTASPLHLYGLLFRVLWPLVAGRVLDAETPLLPSELLARLGTGDAFALVSTPAHLRRLARHERLGTLAGRCRAVFSSGGPLPGDTAESVATALGVGVVEIYGSTETGGIATRTRRTLRDEPAWTPLPGVDVWWEAGSGRAVVRSPFVTGGTEEADGRERFVTGDAIASEPDGGFRLEGRVDRVVKVGEKRLSLPEMEARLREHRFVDDARLVMVERGGELRVAAAVVPSAEGLTLLGDAERRRLAEPILAHLAELFDRVLLPRAFRFVRTLPSDVRGKEATAAALRALFEGAAADASREPEIQGERRGPGRIERALRVPEDLVFLEGHFPGRPVVPGVVILGWALDAAKALVGRDVALSVLERLKFQEMLQPGDSFDLVVGVAGDAFEFEAHAGARRLAWGRGRLLETPPDRDDGEPGS